MSARREAQESATDTGVSAADTGVSSVVGKRKREGEDESAQVDSPPARAPDSGAEGEAALI